LSSSSRAMYNTTLELLERVADGAQGLGLDVDILKLVVLGVGVLGVVALVGHTLWAIRVSCRPPVSATIPMASATIPMALDGSLVSGFGYPASVAEADVSAFFPSTHSTPSMRSPSAPVLPGLPLHLLEANLGGPGDPPMAEGDLYYPHSEQMQKIKCTSHVKPKQFSEFFTHILFIVVFSRKKMLF
jgi:hypothetical protein